MTDILKRLDRMTALQKEVQQIFSRLHEHIMACPQDDTIGNTPGSSHCHKGQH